VLRAPHEQVQAVRMTIDAFNRIDPDYPLDRYIGDL
jgi:hypothetical protein